ncbi:hypothetical protein RZN05_08015 [Sphingomonas sp. HF-S4]|uniref:Uncharacterized protein n=1 Tax=Sphingomonas agrestis TaxID=3080540 RepID=A0ABU3Y6B6_9SPHN|nr:hypothetical protein [Sphingomonas sp. HF-S4]MDV3456924.1 hypothetical protein [Sphingomonas sp. HF-S4]
MSKDYESSVWAQHHADLSGGIAHFFGDILQAFECLVAIEFDAPWERHGS